MSFRTVGDRIEEFWLAGLSFVGPIYPSFESVRLISFAQQRGVLEDSLDRNIV